MKGKNGVKLADFIRKMINTKISEKSVKSMIFEDFEGIRKAPPRLLLSSRPSVRFRSGMPKTQPKSLVKSRFFGVFLFLRRNSKNGKSQIFIIGQQIYL